MKKYIKRLIKEIIPVVIGVFIALYINNWNENRKDNTYVDKIYSSIKKDLTETSERISTSRNKQKKVIDTIKVYFEDDKAELLETIFKGGGLVSTPIRTSSWDAVSNSKIELLDYDKAVTLSNIGMGKQHLEMKAQYLMNFVYNNSNNSSKQKKELLIFMISDLIAIEDSIQKEIEKVINE